MKKWCVSKAQLEVITPLYFNVSHKSVKRVDVTLETFYVLTPTPVTELRFYIRMPPNVSEKAEPWSCAKDLHIVDTHAS